MYCFHPSMSDKGTMYCLMYKHMVHMIRQRFLASIVGGISNTDLRKIIC